MKRLIATRDAHAVYERWFVRPIPPRDTALNLPMNHLLRDFQNAPQTGVPGQAGMRACPWFPLWY